MCGIAGIMTADGSAPDADVLTVLQSALQHRGPDGMGQYLGEGIGLAHARLAIIDLETGDQPIQAPDGATLIANAEIYNYVELRQALDEEGDAVAWQTRSDCEPALHLYRRHGIDFAEQLRGMYAIAIHDPTAGQLILARDPFGIKPVYYVEGDFGFAFGII